MLDINFIREHKAEVIAAAHAKNKPVDEFIDRLLELDEKRKSLLQQIEKINQARNEISLATKDGKPSPEIIEKGSQLKKELQEAESILAIVATEYVELLEKVPNMPSEDTPIGKDESENKVLREVGNKPNFSFTPLPHEVLGQRLGLLDNERAAKVSGSRFTYVKNELVFLEFALIQYALSILTNKEILATIAQENDLDVPANPFIPILPPVLIKEDVLHNMARLEPKEERYHMEEDNLYLVGSAEHTIGAMHMNELLPEGALPLRYIGFSSAFRREAGSYGKDVKGILRLHQFDKLEMESFTTAETSHTEQDFLVAIQEYLLQKLEIPYRVVMCCTGDMGDPDARHIDVESWMPGQDQYRETHSADLMTDYQSRRLKTRVKRTSGETQFVHMNDATALAIGRTLIALMENHQQEDGSIVIPQILHPYLPFTTIKNPEA